MTERDDPSDPDDALTDDDRATLTAKLEDELIRLREQAESFRQSAAPVSLDLSIGRLSRVDALQQQQMASAARARVQLAIRMAEGALRRLKSGTYGECARCDGDIGRRRLLARPSTPYCRACEEDELSVHGR